MSSEQVNGPGDCTACDGRGWKYVQPRRSLIVARGTDRAAVLVAGDRVPCTWCNGTKRGVSWAA